MSKTSEELGFEHDVYCGVGISQAAFILSDFERLSTYDILFVNCATIEIRATTRNGDGNKTYVPCSRGRVNLRFRSFERLCTQLFPDGYIQNDQSFGEDTR